MRTKNTLIVIFGFLLIFYSSINGQSTFLLDTKATTFIDNSLMECFYDYTVMTHPRFDSTQETVAITFNTLLQVNASVSKFWDWHSFKMDSIFFTAVTPLSTDSSNKISALYNHRVRYLYIPVVFKNYPKEKITVIDDIAPDVFIYNQPKTDINWNMEDDTMTVCGYLCSKATASYGGREWTAWYAPEIAVSDGPWKFYGLPGLILKAVDATGEHAFDAVVIRNAVHPIYLTKDFQRIKIKKDKFLKQKLWFDKDPFVNLKLNPTAKEYTFMYESSVFINWKHTSIFLDVDYNPLELE